MSNILINTTQNVKLFFTPASIDKRILAYLIDFLVKGSYLITVVLVLNKADSFDINSINDNAAVMALLILISCPLFFYTLLSEWLMLGQTLGKRMLKIKVVKIDGYQAGFLDYFTRWLFILVDMALGFLPGLICMILSQYNQRIGDFAAGTAIISEKSTFNISHTILMDIEDEYTPRFSYNQILVFSDNDIRIIKESFENAQKNRSSEIMERLVSKIESLIKIKNPYITSEEFINILLKDYNFYTSK